MNTLITHPKFTLRFMKRLALIALLFATPLAAMAQFVVFTDNFNNGSTTNHTSMTGPKIWPMNCTKMRTTTAAAITLSSEKKQNTAESAPKVKIERAADGEIRLTPTEWHVVEVLVRNAGKLVSQRQLLQEVWGPQYGTETNYLRVYLAQIRRKLEPDPAKPRYFITEARMGYRFEPDGPGQH
jgi:hypothetical protein